MSWECGSQKNKKNYLISNEELLQKEGFMEEKEAKLLFYQFLRNNITFSTDLITGVKLFPFQHMAIKGMLESDYFLAVWSRGLSKCTNKNSLIFTNNGIKKAIDVQIGDYVLAKNSMQLVEGKTVNKKQKTYKITTDKGYESEGLDYHRILILNKNLEQEWKFAKDLSIGDCIIMRKNGFFSNQINIFAGFSIEKERFDQVVIDPLKISLKDWYYFFGIFIGDGCFTNKIIQITSEDIEIKNFLMYFCDKLNLNLKIYQKKNNKAQSFTISNKSLQKFLEFCGFEVGKKAVNKIIPYKLLNCSKDSASNLLKGLFDTDGYASISAKRRNSNGAKIGFTSTSYELIKQVRTLLLIFGIDSTTKISFKGGESNFSGKKYICNKAWTILLSTYENIKIFKDSIGFLINRKQEKLNIINAAKYIDGQFSNTIPFIGEYLISKYNKKSICKKNKNQQIKLPFRKKTNRTLAKNLANFVDLETSNKINNLLDENLFFDFVKIKEESLNETVDLQVANEHCYMSDGFINHNSYTCGIFAALDAIFNQGVEIGILSRSFRQSKMIFKKIEDIAAKPEAYLLKQCITHVSKSNDEWVMEIGKSRIRALPLGDGEKLRGFRFHRIIIDEFLLMPERIYNEVIVPFLSVVQNPTQREELYNLETQLIEKDEMKEEDRYQWPNNKLIALSSASFKFEYLYKLYEQYENLIFNPKTKDTTRRCVMQFSYDCAPTQLYDQNLINQAKATMSESQFLREFGAQFTDDSSGYFKISKMALCTIPDGELPSIEVAGHAEDEYIVSVDPSWSETESSDDFAIQVLKINREKQISTLVHSYALSGSSLKDHIKYFLYILQNFNVVAICMDYNGGVQFMNSCNESELFKDAKINLKSITTEFERPEEYAQNLFSAKMEYNKSEYKYVFLRKPTSSWIRLANEMLQANFDHRRIFFGSRAIDDNFRAQTKRRIGITNLKFSNSLDSEKENEEAKMIDFVEHLTDMILLTKTECALIQITTSAQGLQNFDLPANLKRKTGPDKPRKDSYSALVLGNWLAKIYFDMENTQVDNVMETFEPLFIA
jgi:intein/homing endonuclease